MSASFPEVGFEQWRAQVEQELKGVAFEKALVTSTPEGVAVQPLYVDAPAIHALPRGATRPDEWVSSVRFHERGADSSDELALLLSQAAARSSLGGVGLELVVGRDTLLELAKVRAARVLWAKLQVALELPVSPVWVRAQCSRRVLTQRDPWVNMLRTTTQVFAALTGGADEVVPLAYDADFGGSALGARVARNTELVLRHESDLGRVDDPAAGSYALESLTDGLAREAWKRFQTFEREGGFAAIEPSLETRFEKAWAARLERIAKRREPVLGVSEFANLAEQLPAPVRVLTDRRDAEAFEALRRVADGKKPRALLLTLGSFAESRPRTGFAAGLLAAGGIETLEATTPEALPVAVLCGTDERYGSDGERAAASLKAAGCARVLVAGRPGPNEPALRSAGVDGFIFMGVDVIETLRSLLEVYP